MIPNTQAKETLSWSQREKIKRNQPRREEEVADDVMRIERYVKILEQYQDISQDVLS